MGNYSIGDIVARKSYGGDIYFKVSDVATRKDGKNVYALKGLLYRIEADSIEDDLVIQDPQSVYREIEDNIMSSGMNRTTENTGVYTRLLNMFRGTAGRILHVDSSEDFLNMCLKYYGKSRLKVTGKVISESNQPSLIRSLLESTKADILIVTGHDGIKKDATKMNSIDSYRNSKYYIQSVREARKYEPSMDKLCVFAGACQSYFEGIMDAGANFASSPGRILIHALDPGKVGDRVALTESKRMVTPEKIAELTESGMKGIGGVATRGHYRS